ncbi:YbjQ family protein [Candidatus Bipolaricaulota bacterium]|nr:YbjQ family protein [Candidatus Bipolaricaulota bacterium]HHR84982.1 heavy metal-binding domain-containing protein [Candidatus Acetothermia bacterium]
MIIVTTETIEGRKIEEVLGLVRGNTIRARNMGRDIMAGLRNIVGGEIKDYTRMLSQARDQALDRMIRDAESKGATAILGVRFTTSQTMAGAAEILAYGTAVRLAS